jgi:dCMP deaminase
MKPEKVQNLLAQAEVQARLSPDAQTKVGAIIVDKDGGTLLSSYNGFISGAPDKKLPTSGIPKYEYLIHAEANSIARAARKGIKLDDSILVCTLSPCKSCTRLLFQSGIRTVYFKTKYKDFDENLAMKDLKVTIYPIADYFKMVLEAAKNE